MADNGFDVSQTGGVTIVTFESATVLDIATSQVMAEALLHLADGPAPPRIIVDFSAVRFLASRMLSILVQLSKRAETHQGKVVICGLRSNLSRIFRVTQLDRLLTFADDRDRALAALGDGGQA
jgi:anti-sigma B factor antagonist